MIKMRSISPLGSQQPLPINPMDEEYTKLFYGTEAYRYICQLVSNGMYNFENPGTPIASSNFLEGFPTSVVRIKHAGDNPATNIMYQTHEFNIFPQNYIMSYENEYNAQTSAGHVLYGEDMMQNIHKVAYDAEHGWHSIASPNIRFPYSSIYAFANDAAASTFNYSPHISYTMIPFPSRRDEDTSHIKLSVIINAWDRTVLERFAYLLASFRCEILHPFPRFENNNPSITLYRRLMHLENLRQETEIDFHKLERNILHTFPSQLDTFDMSNGRIQLILALDSVNNPTEDDLRNRERVKGLFINYCTSFGISDYVIFSPSSNMKLSPMRNLSLKYATGDFIIFRDDDDISSSLGSIVRKCLDYGSPNWETGKILRYSCPFSGKYTFRTFGMWGLIIPKALSNYIRHDATNASGEDITTLIHLMFQGVLQEADDLSDVNPLCGKWELDVFEKLLNGEYTLESDEKVRMPDSRIIPMFRHAEVGFSRFARALYLYEKEKNRLGSHYEEAKTKFRQALENAKSYYATTRRVRFDNIRTFMYVYCEQSFTYDKTLVGIDDIRFKSFLDSIIPNNPFKLDSPKSFEFRISDAIGLDLFSLSPESKDISSYKFLHPDEQVMLKVETCNNGTCTSTEETRWVTHRIVGLPQERRLPLQTNIEGIRRHNKRLKDELTSTLFGGNSAITFGKILLVILILLIIISVIRYENHFHRFINKSSMYIHKRH